ncbi:hypothetical protein GQR58_029726 [Nymphon striatum]|nr:hypothetical protein GQR58_029726 [Nymphon striatum]
MHTARSPRWSATAWWTTAGHRLWPTAWTTATLSPTTPSLVWCRASPRWQSPSWQPQSARSSTSIHSPRPAKPWTSYWSVWMFWLAYGSACTAPTRQRCRDVAATKSSRSRRCPPSRALSWLVWPPSTTSISAALALAFSPRHVPDIGEDPGRAGTLTRQPRAPRPGAWATHDRLRQHRARRTYWAGWPCARCLAECSRKPRAVVGAASPQPADHALPYRVPPRRLRARGPAHAEADLQAQPQCGVRLWPHPPPSRAVGIRYPVTRGGLHQGLPRHLGGLRRTRRWYPPRSSPHQPARRSRLDRIHRPSSLWRLGSLRQRPAQAALLQHHLEIAAALQQLFLRRAACTPISTALSQCSTRIISLSKRWLGQRATSPAATTPGAARQVASQTTPLSTVRPEPSSHSVLGMTPIPTTTTSASRVEPSERVTERTRPSPSRASTPTPSRSGTGAISTMVTSSPWLRAVAATSAPMNPAPQTTTRLGAEAKSARMAMASLSVRSVCTPSNPWALGKLRVRAPVAMNSPSKATDESSLSATRRFSRSRPVARTPKRRSRLSSSHLSSAMRPTRSGSHSPDNTCLESGGRVAAAVRSGPLHDGVFAVQHHHCAALGGHVIEVRGDNLTRRHRLFFGVGSDDKRHQNVVGSQAALLAGRSAPCSPTPGWRRSRPHTPEGRPPSPRPRHLDQQPAPQDPPCNQILLQAWAGGGMRHRAIGRAILDSFGRLRNAHQAGGHHGVACERATRWVDLCTFLIDTQSVHKHVLVGGKRGVQLGNVDLVVGHASALAGLDSRWSSGEVSRPEMMHIDAQQPGLKRRHRKGIGPQRRNVIRIELGGQHIAQRPRAGLAVAIDQRSVDLAHLQLHPLLRTAQRRRPSPHGFR